METSVIEEIMEGIREKEIKEKYIGYVVGVNGPVVIGREMSGCVMYELVRIGPKGLIGEVIRIKNNTAIIQVYEETSGLGVDDIIIREGRPLRVELGPGLYESIFDGIQRPLDEIKEKTGGYYIPRGIKLPSLSRTRDYCFIPRRQKGDVVGPGDIIGEVQENSLKTTKILIPPKSRGRIVYIAEEGFYTHEDVIAELEGEETNEEIFLFHSWPVRIPRPVKCRFDSTEPVFTGQRVLDTLFPCAKGGTIAIPGAFGCGKTVISHALSKHSNSDSIVYVGCGERGNEISEVLRDFPKLCIGKTGESIMKRTVLVANTSNMPVAAREASIYTGITIAEYFRDQGMDVTMMADSTSRWAEALREISGRLAEMPADSGYPAYLSARLSMFYERAGAVNCLGSPDRIGSVTIVGAVSPPGGDFSDPVTAATLGIVKVFWGLDKRLAQRKHFPSINVSKSYSRCKDRLESFYASMYPDFLQHRSTCYEILHKESKIFEIVQLVGRNAISEDEKLYMDIAKVIREDFLQQNGYSSYDASCPLEKTAKMLENIVLYFNSAIERIKKSNNTWESILERTDKSFQAIKRMKFIEIDGKMSRRLDEVKNLILSDFASLP